MNKTTVVILAFAGGVATGLLAAKFYAEYKVKSGLHGALDAFGLAGGTLEHVLDPIVVGLTVG